MTFLLLIIEGYCQLLRFMVLKIYKNNRSNNIIMILLLLANVALVQAYLNNWFPVVSIKNTDFSNPKQIKILGKDFVLWKKEK